MKLNPDLIKFGRNETDITSTLGTGSFGVVYKMFYGGTPVAVKELKESRRGGYQNMFFSEIKTLKKLRHPHIINIISFDEIRIVMELADGDGNSVDNNEDIYLIGRDCMRALTFMQYHGKCVMHSDIKPANILLFKDKSGRVTKAVLGDVGLADFCGKNGKNECVGDFTGTIGYMPLTGNKNINGFDDIHALAVSLLDMFKMDNPPPELQDGIYTEYCKAGRRISENTKEGMNKIFSLGYHVDIFDIMLKSRLVKEGRLLQDFMLSLIHNFDILSKSPTNNKKFQDHITLQPREINEILGPIETPYESEQPQEIDDNPGHRRNTMSFLTSSSDNSSSNNTSNTNSSNGMSIDDMSVGNRSSNNIPLGDTSSSSSNGSSSNTRTPGFVY